MNWRKLLTALDSDDCIPEVIEILDSFDLGFIDMDEAVEELGRQMSFPE